MLCKEKWRRCGSAIAALACVGVLSAPALAPATPLYPDLRTAPLVDIQTSTALVNGEHHYVIRFSNTVWNAGTGPFELHGSPHFPLDGLFDASQWVYDDSGAPAMHRVGTFAYHPSHSHFHFDGFARYELWTKRAYDRAAASGFTSGTPQYVSPKVSFCVFDYGHTDPSQGPPAPVYHTCTPLLEGISVGWGDTYDSFLPDQWVDVGTRPLADGDYVLRSIVDPTNELVESPGKSDPARESPIANSAVADVKIVNGRLVNAGGGA